MKQDAKHFLGKVLRSYNKRLLFTLHAVNQMNLPERLITKDEIREVITQKEIIEYCPDDSRGSSRLMVGKTKAKRVIHVLCASKRGFLLIITAYIPFPDEWQENSRIRRRD